ncbi:MAG: DUF192 domain-containing protein [Anaerolineae bacterium]
MKRYLRLHRPDGTRLPLRVRRCDTFWCRLRGLMFRRELPSDEGLLFVESGESRMLTTIHMLFVFFPIGVVWMAADGRVVDMVVARPFRLRYTPHAPAKYYLEGPPALVEWVEPGERLTIE